MHPVTLILGGARSGKSRYAQALAARAARVLFIATAAPVDDEMRAKIDRHRADRIVDHLAHWTVVEEPLALGETMQNLGPQHDLILVDCLTLFASNLLNLTPTQASHTVDALYRAIAAPPCPVLLVSNEVGSGIVPAFASGRRFRDLLGEINQHIAALVSDVVLLVSGLPLVLKSSAPSSVPQPTAVRLH